MMTVAELIAILSEMPADAVVEYMDTYAVSEGWGERDTTCEAEIVFLERDRVVIG